MIKWLSLDFDQLTTKQLYDMLSLRAEVFVVEQAQAYQDVDYRDLKCRHILAYDGDTLAAHSRIFPVGGYFPSHACIGRVVVRPSFRGTGLGHTLIDKAIAESINLNGNVPITISAQLRLRHYYEQHGFVKSGTTYQEDNITHIHMTLNPNQL